MSRRETIRVKAASERTHITMPIDGRRRFVGGVETTRITHTEARVVPYNQMIRRALADGDLVEVPGEPTAAPFVEPDSLLTPHQEG